MPPIEEIVADIFKQVLDLDDDIGIDSNFFDLGGHSMLAVKVAANLTQALTQPISPAMVFQAPTPRTMAPLLDAGLATPSSHITPLQPLGDGRPVFCFHDLFSRPVSYISLARVLAPEQPMYGVAPGPLESTIIANPKLEILTPAYVAAIRHAQPRGPYHVMGYSFGGLPAFDVAHALLDQGEDVLLTLIDPYIKRAMPNPVQIVRWTLRHRSWVLKKIYRTPERWLDPQGGVSMKKVPGWVPLSSHPLAIALLQAQASYRFRPFKGPTVFVQATVRDPVQDLLNADGLNGWNGLLNGPLSRHEVQAPHFWMMRDPLVSKVAGILRTSVADAFAGTAGAAT